jgi:hypothetical protein
MSNPTSNFGWQMPTPTDLVTDLPADFEVFGQAVDTSLADLRGGTTGQVLSKTTNSDMDFTWVAANPGDITGVTAGTGISGGGTSGTVTVTNDMATTITASGDIVVGTGSGTYDNLPIGTTGQILTADTTVSPYKVKWATPAGGSTFVGVSCKANANQTISNATYTLITWNQENFDTDGFHDVSTNTSRITIPAGKGGYYKIDFYIQVDSSTAGTRNFYLNKNGTQIPYMVLQPGNQNPSVNLSYVMNLVAGDYIEIETFQTSGGSATFLKAYDAATFSAFLIGV